MTQSIRTRRRAVCLLSIGLAVAGAAVLAGLLVFGTAPSSWGLWAVLAVAFVLLEFASVEVNDRLRISSSVMVAFTAAVVFGRASAPFAVALMAAFAMLQPDDVRNRRWIQPLANFGQLVLSSAAGMLIFVLFLPEGPVGRSDLPLMVLGAVLGAVSYNYLNFHMVAGFVRLAYPGRSMRPWSNMLPNHVALTTLAVVGALLGAAYQMVGAVILPLILMTYLVGYTGFSTHARLREAHESTIRGFVKVIEALDPHTRGRTDRVVHFCRIIAEEMNLTPDRMDTLRWAALIHDVSKLAAPGQLLRKDGPLTDAEYNEVVRHLGVGHLGVVGGVLSEVDFLRPMVEISAAAHSVQGKTAPWRAAVLEARILAAADVFDARTSTRSYRSAVTQAEAFTGLHRQADRFGTDVVAAFVSAVDRRGEVYGSPDAESSARVQELVRERAIRA